MIWRRDRLVADETADWVFDRFHWLIATLGPRNFFEHTRLVLPTREFFSLHDGGGSLYAQRLFDELRAHMGVEHWPCKLVARAVLGRNPRNRAFSPNAVAGTFYQRGDGAIITYDPRLLKERSAFLGTMAHELAHYILAPHAHAAPGGDEEHEMLTDLTVVAAGLGLVDLLGGRRMGWRGYLDVDARLFALAIFLRLHGQDIAAAAEQFDRHLTRRIARADRQLGAYATQLSYLDALRP